MAKRNPRVNAQGAACACAEPSSHCGEPAEGPVARRVERWLSGPGARFPRSRSSIIPVLQAVQAEFGYLPREAMDAVARHLRVSPVTLEGVASFYAQFRFEKPGRHRITVCRGTACHVRGSGKLLDDLAAALKVEPGRTTADGEFTVETVACFGACALAPVVVADGTVQGRVNTASLASLVKRTRGARRARSPRAARARA